VLNLAVNFDVRTKLVLKRIKSDSSKKTIVNKKQQSWIMIYGANYPRDIFRATILVWELV
jgi:hypothetical protein